MPTDLALDRWRMKDFDVGAGGPAGAFAADLEADDWIDVTAPGDTYVALHAAGRIDHPFNDRAEETCSWVPEQEWWWRTDFESPVLAAGQRLILDFEGLDTFAEVWLNGAKIATSDNMFVPLRLDVTGLVKPAPTSWLSASPPPRPHSRTRPRRSGRARAPRC